MLPDKFFEEYAKTGPEPAPDTLDDPSKKTYTAAEVDELVNRKVAEAVESIQARLAAADDNGPVSEPAETDNE